MPFGTSAKFGPSEPVMTVSQEMALTRASRVIPKPPPPVKEGRDERAMQENIAYYGGPSVAHQKALSGAEPVRKRRVEQLVQEDYITTRRERRAHREATTGVLLAPQSAPGVAQAVNPNVPDKGISSSDPLTRRQQLQARLNHVVNSKQGPALEVRQVGAAVSIIPRSTYKQETKVGTPVRPSGIEPTPGRTVYSVPPIPEKPILQHEPPTVVMMSHQIRERSRRTSMAQKNALEGEEVTDGSNISYSLPETTATRRRVQPGGIRHVAASTPIPQAVAPPSTARLTAAGRAAARAAALAASAAAPALRAAEINGPGRSMTTDEVIRVSAQNDQLERENQELRGKINEFTSVQAIREENAKLVQEREELKMQMQALHEKMERFEKHLAQKASGEFYIPVSTSADDPTYDQVKPLSTSADDHSYDEARPVFIQPTSALVPVVNDTLAEADLKKQETAATTAGEEPLAIEGAEITQMTHDEIAVEEAPVAAARRGRKTKKAT